MSAADGHLRTEPLSHPCRCVDLLISLTYAGAVGHFLSPMPENIASQVRCQGTISTVAAYSADMIIGSGTCFTKEVPPDRALCVAPQHEPSRVSGGHLARHP